MSLPPLAAQHCQNPAHRIDDAGIAGLMAALPHWTIKEGMLRRCFDFTGFDETMAFINAVAWVSRREDHHPDVSFGYDTCTLSYRTHSANGLTLNDFICAAKIDALLAP